MDTKQWVQENRFKINSNKGFYGITKGVVTRNLLYLPKPNIPKLIDKNNIRVANNNKWDVQVWIPSLYDGMANIPTKPDINKIGEKDTYGMYPWAEVCGPLFKDQIGTDKSDYPDVWSSMFSGKYMQDCPSTYPGIGDVVFIMFENGDITRPIVIGSLMCDRNSVRYHDTEQSGNDDYFDLYTRINGKKGE